MKIIDLFLDFCVFVSTMNQDRKKNSYNKL